MAVPDLETGCLAQLARLAEQMRILSEQYGDRLARDEPDLHAAIVVLETSLGDVRSAHGGSSARRDGAE